MQHNVDAQRRFIADAAHQMRTPLTGLKTQAQLAMRESDPGELRHALRQILSGVDRASHLVDQLLALARAEASGDAQQPLLPLDVDQLLREIVETWVVRALDKRIDLGYEAAGAVLIEGNAFLLREMINNLLDNALRYTPAGGRVTARVVAQGDFAVLEIEDSGPGIADEDSHKVFDRFYRVPRVQTARGAASGWRSFARSPKCIKRQPVCVRTRLAPVVRSSPAALPGSSSRCTARHPRVCRSPRRSAPLCLTGESVGCRRARVAFQRYAGLLPGIFGQASLRR
jgi:hypothetical protein